VPLLIFVFYRAAGRPFAAGNPGGASTASAAGNAPCTGPRPSPSSRWRVTGIIIMFGKNIMMPWMGHTLFSWVAIISKYLHNVVGPLFVLCSILMFFTFLRRNFFNRIDWQWVKQGGGLVSHKHVPAGFFNAGEKSWFWFGVVLLGLVMSITGLILDFVTFGQTRYVMQMANYLHIGGATLYMAAAMGHIYIGTVGTPGAYDAMRHGSVDENWAKAHHALWYEEVKSGAAPDTGATRPGHCRQARRVRVQHTEVIDESIHTRVPVFSRPAPARRLRPRPYQRRRTTSSRPSSRAR
jgi:formate dehydrogenase subunit gamma